ncbi:extracellular solute-binding protein [Spiroplasma endosymbiont of Labia minor]|uniref:extracellular solute-binding protein n=1 Tax=Spiroplasma endosymbiont of Labia minor TaxID=3066305 RepID=UPI0030D2E0AD
MIKLFRTSYFALIILFIYIPISIVIVFSFNSGQSVFNWNGFTTDWYATFFRNSPFIKSIVTSLFVAMISTTISVIIGVLASVGLSRLKPISRSAWFSIANIPLINADVITAVSLMAVFIIAGMKFGIVTLIMAHVSFNVPYVLITVMPRIKIVDKNLINASSDLGASKFQTFFKIILPMLRPVIITATVICFAMSFDDFIISYFTSGGDTNVSTFIYSAKKIKPYVFAFGTILVAIIAFAIIIWNIINIISQKKQESIKQIRDGKYKLKQVMNLQKKINKYQEILNSKTKIKITGNLILLIKYIWLKIKILLIKIKRYDQKIQKLEWKIYRLKDEIRYEKKLRINNAKSKKRLEQLKTLIINNEKKQRKQRIQNALVKLENKVEKQRLEINWYDNHARHIQEKIDGIDDLIFNLKNNQLNTANISKKSERWYAKKYKALEFKKAILIEGKIKYKLRMAVNRIEEIQKIKTKKQVDIAVKLNEIKNKVFIRIPLVSEINIDKMQQRLNFYRHKLINKEQKLDDLYKVISRKIAEILNPDNDKYRPKIWISRSWKWLVALIVFAASFTGLTVAYIRNNIYDLIIANWGEYIDIDLIGKFENEFNVNVNYQEYDSNETLYNKLYTIDYDVMMPSDYMVQRLEQENRLEKLNVDKLKMWGKTASSDYYNKSQDNKDLEISSKLLDVMSSSKIESGSNENLSITDYSVPYFWGDLIVVVNSTHVGIKDWLFNTYNAKLTANTSSEIDESSLSWDIFQKAADSGFNVVLNFDAKNIFQIGLQQLYQTENANDLAEIDAASVYVKNLVTKNNVFLQGDELMTTLGSGNFDIAMVYNGDAIWSNKVFNHEDDDNASNDKSNIFYFGRPGRNGMGTNVFSDNMVMSKNSKHKDLAYNFINFMYENALDNTKSVGLTSPVQKAIDDVVMDDQFKRYASIYQPLIDQNTNYKSEAFKFNAKIDNYMMDLFNSIISGKN